MSILWPFDDIFDISIPTGGSEFDILTTAFLSAIVPFLILTIVIQLSCWLCCSGSKNRRKARARECEKYVGSDAQLVAEAKRWLKQATHDRQSAANDYISEYPAYEWVCFKCQQSAEKAVKAVLFSTGRLRQHQASEHDLIEQIKPFQGMDEHLETVITDLHSCIGFVSFMRYPDKHPFPTVPHDAFSRDQAELALGIVDALLQHIREKYLDVK